MELKGIVHNGVIVLDDATLLPEGARVRVTPVALEQEQPKTFAERYSQFRGVIQQLPSDLAEQHDHYRLGTPKR